jgi:hypothetical protein
MSLLCVIFVTPFFILYAAIPATLFSEHSARIHLLLLEI